MAIVQELLFIAEEKCEVLDLVAESILDGGIDCDGVCQTAVMQCLEGAFDSLNREQMWDVVFCYQELITLYSVPQDDDSPDRLLCKTVLATLVLVECSKLFENRVFDLLHLIVRFVFDIETRAIRSFRFPFWRVRFLQRVLGSIQLKG